MTLRSSFVKSPSAAATRRQLAVLLGGGALAAAGGVLSAAVAPWVGFAGLAAAGLLAAILANARLGLLCVIGVLYVLPFGVIPVPLGGVRLTFLDVTLTLTLLVWLAASLGTRQRILIPAIGGAIAVFLLLAFTSLVMGIESTPPESVRLFMKMVNSVLVCFTVVNVVRDAGALRQATAAVLLAAGGAAALALMFYVIPATVASALLGSLARLGYPEVQVLRYIADTEILRATGTAVDPNVLGGMLLLVMPLLVTQLFGPEPVLNRRVLACLLLAVVAALVLSYSRGSWLGAAVGCLFVGTLQYRRVWLALGVAAALLLITPQGELVMQRFQEGVTFEDRASQMRLGEYKDALRLIERYPFLGVGFGRAPEMDIYVASSSIYLMMASQMGLIGLSAFLAVVVLLYRHALGRRPRITNPGLRSLQIGALGGVSGALAAGLFDHFFFNLQFPHTGALFWLMIGLTTAVTMIGAPSTDDTANVRRMPVAGRPTA